ncbi:MAG TPA: DegT/DnrJ/EryC1/StrS family aminotransferase [Oscillatoriales cyanobacterium M59_W2019_021]|nr:MAG: DegT/DnrJ/EryC1/StrS family aminotransferase [Cyanobacteria bacterium J055]HIK33674.1 DegT/DnrJ/EryC1/StrS family aminotransferase [Oscillatoriales cyanobacterium M4454_W2019_049]HIK52676.1 DegT/DnrJ/EryC1/StrS family aminotransferase [Oscillatoriales cyanobacterium M59_W2019_021]
MNSIPPLDLARQYRTIALEVEAAVLEVLSSGRYIGGSQVQAFECQFADYIGTTECVSCHSGTDALYLALRSLEIGPGDEVITTALSFFATAETISMVGATPVFVDIDAATFNCDVDRLEAAITPRTKAILPVHLFGQPVDMTRLMEVANAHRLAVVEDCAQAAGAEWNGKKVGSFGRIGCFSFFPTKNLGAFGDGGAITTDDREIADRIRVLKDHGATRRYYHEFQGTNSRLDALQAAILQVKLPYLDGWNARRRDLAARYRDLLAPIPHIVLPQDSTGGGHVWNQYTIRIESDRDRLYQQLQQSGIGCNIYYPFPLHLQPAYRDLGYAVGQLPIAERACQQVLSLPMFPELDVEEQYQVVRALKDCR